MMDVGITELTDTGNLGMLAMVAWQAMRLVRQIEKFIADAMKHRDDVSNKLDKLIDVLEGKRSGTPKHVDFEPTPIRTMTSSGD